MAYNLIKNGFQYMLITSEDSRDEDSRGLKFQQKIFGFDFWETYSKGMKIAMKNYFWKMFPNVNIKYLRIL